jgi:type I restriction enzyme M protein
VLENDANPAGGTQGQRDVLATVPHKHASVVLANPPIGHKSSITVIANDGRATREDIAYERPDFWETTSNKQLNFVQHIASLLAIQGWAAVVVPDNVLFEGGAGEQIRRRLLKQFDVHTLLRLPTGIFYSGGVKANALFFDKRPAAEHPWTRQLWVYDFRTGQHFTLKQNPLRREHLQEFVDCYLPGKDRSERVEMERFRVFALTSWSRATRRTSTSPGSRTRASREATISCHQR